MKKTRLNSIVFVIICSLLLVVAVGGVAMYGITLYKHTGQIGTLIVTVIAVPLLFISGGAFLSHVHEDIFGEVLTYCEDCTASFNQEQIEKQVEHTANGKMYVEHRCPYCKASLI